jgi:serine/threonine protein kinase
MICCLNPNCPNPENPDGNKYCQSCSVPLTPLLRGRYWIAKVLSDEGGFGRTYLAEDVDKLNEHCVVKQLAPKFHGTWALKKAMELFQEEAKRLQELGKHPQIPTLLAYFEQDKNLYLVQEFIDGQNLLKEIKQRGTYSESEIRQLLLDLLPVLKFIHERGVIHRDIKPQNIMRHQSDGKLVLIDFGASKQLTATVQTKPGTTIGSHGYSPVEQLKGGEAYPASDLFSLGANCFHLLSGISPFQLWIDHGYSWVVNWRQYLRSPVSSELSEVLDKLLKKDFQERYQSADEVLTDLTPQPLPPPPIPPTQPLPPRIQAIPTAPATHSKVLLQLVVLLVLVTGAGFLGYLATRWQLPSTTNIGNPPSQLEGTNPIGTVPGQVSFSNLDVGFEISSDREITLSKNKSAPNLGITAPAGSVLQVIEKPIPQQQDSLVHLRVCSVGSRATQLNNSTAQTVKKLSNTKSSTSASKPLVKNGEEGWIQLSQLERLNPFISAPGQSGQCQVNSKAAPDVNQSPLQESPARPPDDDVLPQS